MNPTRLIPFLLIAFACSCAVHNARAQNAGGSGQFVEEAAQKRRLLEAADFDGDGKVSDYEMETYLRWQAMNPGAKMTAKERKILAKRIEAEKKAEIKKYDYKGLGYLDEEENRLRIADQEKKRQQQKKSKESIELSKPIISYLDTPAGNTSTSGNSGNSGNKSTTSNSGGSK
jgi:hypothetical protein